MGERKVLNKYFPPDWDPSRIPRGKKDKTRDQRTEVRMMLPFSMCCNVCGCYMYRGKKFNSKKEIAEGEDYLGIKRIRFYIKCVECNNEITFKTDPKNSDYECEKVRNLPLRKATPHAPCPMPSTPPMRSMPHARHALRPPYPTEPAPPRTTRRRLQPEVARLHTRCRCLSRPARATSPLLSSCTPRAPHRTAPIAFVPTSHRTPPPRALLASTPFHRPVTLATTAHLLAHDQPPL